jgi:tetratricopeptide (TPR) repeat protein
MVMRHSDTSSVNNNTACQGKLMPKSARIIFIIASAFMSLPLVAQAQERLAPLKEDSQQVKTWNQFADKLYQLHQHLIQGKQIRVTEQTGGYGGFTGPRDFYIEKNYYDKASGRLLSRIQWEKDNPDTIHVIEVFIHDDQGRVKRDYLAAYLPGFRNAPIQTLINLHNYNDELHAFRQFDASGERIYETCSGRFFDEEVDIHVMDYELSPYTNVRPAVMGTEAYLACFQGLLTKVDSYLDPANETPGFQMADDGEAVFKHIAELSRQLQAQPDNAALYIKRGNLYFESHQFTESVEDFDRALAIDDSLDEAYFGRGMAAGREGRVKQAIADLTVYLQRNPKSSLAYTKRGVRYIWANDLTRARSDLQHAVLLDDSNSEAHDDLGVILAQAGKHDKALGHFLTAVKHDPYYQKAYHNMALVYFQLADHSQALRAVDKALQLNPGDRNTLMLKSEILGGLERYAEATAIREQAEFLPEGNWSERFSLQ